MRILNSHVKWCDEAFILFLSFTFITDEIEVDREFLKTIVFWHLESLSWELEICCDCEHESEESDFEEMSETFIQDVEKTCEWVIFWYLTDYLIFTENDDMFSDDWTDWCDTDSWTWEKNNNFMIAQCKREFILNLKMIMTVDFLMNSVRNFSSWSSSLSFLKVLVASSISFLMMSDLNMTRFSALCFCNSRFFFMFFATFFKSAFQLYVQFLFSSVKFWLSFACSLL